MEVVDPCLKWGRPLSGPQVPVTSYSLCMHAGIDGAVTTQYLQEPASQATFKKLHTKVYNAANF